MNGIPVTAIFDEQADESVITKGTLDEWLAAEPNFQDKTAPYPPLRLTPTNTKVRVTGEIDMDCLGTVKPMIKSVNPKFANVS